MPAPQYARRVDGNHAEIRNYLRAKIRSKELPILAVIDTHDLGDGFPDLVIVLASGRVSLLFEIKGEKINPTDMVNEVEFMMKLLPENYRIVLSPEMAGEICEEYLRAAK